MTGGYSKLREFHRHVALPINTLSIIQGTHLEHIATAHTMTLIMKINIYWGELTDNSAKKEALIWSTLLQRTR